MHFKKRARQGASHRWAGCPARICIAAWRLLEGHPKGTQAKSAPSVVALVTNATGMGSSHVLPDTVLALCAFCGETMNRLFGQHLANGNGRACQAASNRNTFDSRLMMNPKKATYHATVLWALSVVLSACASTQGDSARSANTPVEHWRNFEAGSIDAAQQNLGSVVFLRDRSLAGKAANIYINGEYFTSLLPSGFKQSPVCAGVNRLTVHYTDVKSRYLEKQREGQLVSIPAGAVRYFKVVAGSGEGSLALEPLEEAQAKAALRGMQEQYHSITRVGDRSRCTALAPSGR